MHTNITRRRLGLMLAATAVSARAHDDEHPPAIARTALIHGIAGPFAVAGYRMGERALAELGLERGSVQTQVVHYAPPQVQWACIIDGLQAATGASLGKMNLELVESTETYSVVRNRKAGRQLRFDLIPAFVKTFRNTPQHRIYDAGLQVAEMKEPEVFHVR